MPNEILNNNFKIKLSSLSESKYEQHNNEIIIIDDDMWTHRIFSKYLSEWGFNPISANNAFEGLNLSLKHRPQLIFLDLILPEMSGELLLKIFKNLDATSDIPIVIISGNFNKELLGGTYKSGACGFISKPFSQKIIYEAMKKCLKPNVYENMKEKGFVMVE